MRVSWISLYPDILHLNLGSPVERLGMDENWLDIIISRYTPYI